MLKTIKIDEFVVSGQSVRTRNSIEAGAAGKIPGLWKKFYASCPQPTAKTYGVYSDYESDATGEFTVTAGTQTDDLNNAHVRIRAGLYLAFPSEGKMPAAIIDAWKTVWQHFSKEQSYVRAYDTDFEEYNGPESAVVYIGIKTSS